VRYDMISTTYLLVFTSQYKEIPEAIKGMILNIDQISSISIINHIRRGLYIPSNAVSPLTSHTHFFFYTLFQRSAKLFQPITSKQLKYKSKHEMLHNSLNVSDYLTTQCINSILPLDTQN
jgi:hypothetical protein